MKMHIGLQTLPPELGLRIIELLVDEDSGNPVLYNLAATCRFFHKLTKSYLYCSLILRPNYFGKPETSVDLLCFLRTMIEQPQLAKQIKSLSIVIPGYQYNKLDVNGQFIEQIQEVIPLDQMFREPRGRKSYYTRMCHEKKKVEHRSPPSKKFGYGDCCVSCGDEWSALLIERKHLFMLVHNIVESALGHVLNSDVRSAQQINDILCSALLFLLPEIKKLEITRLCLSIECPIFQASLRKRSLMASTEQFPGSLQKIKYTCKAKEKRTTVRRTNHVTQSEINSFILAPGLVKVILQGFHLQESPWHIGLSTGMSLLPCNIDNLELSDGVFNGSWDELFEPLRNLKKFSYTNFLPNDNGSAAQLGRGLLQTNDTLESLIINYPREHKRRRQFRSVGDFMGSFRAFYCLKSVDIECELLISNNKDTQALGLQLMELLPRSLVNLVIRRDTSESIGGTRQIIQMIIQKDTVCPNLKTLDIFTTASQLSLERDSGELMRLIELCRETGIELKLPRYTTCAAGGKQFLDDGMALSAFT